MSQKEYERLKEKMFDAFRLREALMLLLFGSNYRSDFYYFTNQINPYVGQMETSSDFVIICKDGVPELLWTPLGELHITGPLVTNGNKRKLDDFLRLMGIEKLSRCNENEWDEIMKNEKTVKHISFVKTGDIRRTTVKLNNRNNSIILRKREFGDEAVKELFEKFHREFISLEK